MLEDTTSSKAPFLSSVFQFISVYGLALILGVVVVVFSLILPDTFPTVFNFRSLLSYQSVVILLALAEMVPLSTDNFDLSIGFLAGLTHILAIGLQARLGLPWWLVIGIVISIGTFFGYFNGILVARIGVPAFIATLGSGTILYGFSYWYSGGQQVFGDLSKLFYAIDSTVFGLIPLPAILVFIICLGLWIVFEYLPLGRYLYVLGANPRAAELTGISAKRYVTLAFMASGTLTALAGVILAAQLRVGQTSVGPDYLLPSFAGALLGATSIRPGRVNVWGTVVAVILLAVAVSGLQQMGAKFYVEPMFNGAMLILAVSLSIYMARRRISISVALESDNPVDQRD